MTADVKFTRRGNALYRKHRIQSALAAVLLVVTLVLFSEGGRSTDNGNIPLGVLSHLFAGLAAALTVRSVVRAAAYLSVSVVMDAFGPDEGDDR